MENLQTTAVKRNFPSYFRNTFAAALGIEILCITSAEIGENLGLFYFGFNQIGIAIAIILGFAFAGFTTFVTILGKSHGKHIHGCCSVLETGHNTSFFQNLKTTLTDYGKGIKKLTRFHTESDKKHILKESLFILISAESGCIIIAEIVGLALYQHSIILSLPIALLAGTSIIVVTTYDKRSRYFIPILVLILISMPFVMTSAYGTGMHFHTFATVDSPPDPSKQSLFQNLTYTQGYRHGFHIHPGPMTVTTSAENSIITSDQMTINGKQYVLDVIILAGTTDLDVPREFSFKLRDKASDQIQTDVTYLFSLKKYNETIFEETFRSDSGNLFVKIIPENPFKFFFEEQSKLIRTSESLPGLAAPLEIVRGPILDSVGAYEISLEILTLGTYSNQVEPPVIHKGILTLSDIQKHQISDSRFGMQEIISNNYFAIVENFQYIEDKNQIKFNFPISSLGSKSSIFPDLGMFLYIPKTFSPFIAKDISVLVNDFLLDEQYIQVLDIDDKTKLIQLVFPAQGLFDVAEGNNEKNIEFVITPSHPDSFPLALFTKDRNYDIFLAWEPPNILSGNEFSLYVQANDESYTVKQLDYELTISQNKEEYLIINGKTSQTKPPKPITIQIPEELNGLAEFEFTFNNNPKTQVEFPIFIGKT